jgi:phosphohistidine phosphatase
MKLFVLRHGRAEPHALTDAQRRLTPSGREDLARLLASCRTKLESVEELWVSPLVRARQSAEIVCEVLGRELPVLVTETLVPEADLDGLYQQLYNSHCKNLMLVSHQPLVGELVNDLCGTEPGYHHFGTSTLACIELEFAASGMGDLQWLRHPLM